MAKALETIAIPGTNLNPTRIALGTWAIGGWMWGGTDAAESIRTIRSAVDRGIDLIDAAPVYGFGRSEEIVGKALCRDRTRQSPDNYQGRSRLARGSAVP
jgi:aryl-alcohol dehydrogenase-like predicted oxidoreductase